MGLSYTLLFATFLIALAAAPLTGETWFWELGNGIGFICLAGILVLTVNGRSGAGRGHNHRWVGIAVLVAMWIHALWFLLGDPVAIEYIKFGAPAYMVAGLLALGLCTLLTISSLRKYRKSNYHGRQEFRFWHRWLSTTVLAASIWHVAASGYYFQSVLQWVLLGIVVIFTYVYPRLPSTQPIALAPGRLLITSVIALGLFVFVRVGLQPLLQTG